jgi:hypothetical protein
MSINIKSLASVQQCVSNNKALAFFVPNSGSTIYEPVPGFEFVVGVSYGGCIVDRIEHTASGMLWGINDDGDDYLIIEEEENDWELEFATDYNIDWVRVEAD